MNTHSLSNRVAWDTMPPRDLSATIPRLDALVRMRQLVPSKALRGMHSWGPAAVAVSIIPFLPLVDPPVEWFLDWAFNHKVRVIGGYSLASPVSQGCACPVASCH